MRKKKSQNQIKSNQLPPVWSDHQRKKSNNNKAERKLLLTMQQNITTKTYKQKQKQTWLEEG